MANTLKEMLYKEGIIVAPGCYDPLSSLLCERIGYKANYLGGWSVGAHLGITEPLTTLTEMVDTSRRITHVSNIPLIVDAGSSFGHLPMVHRTVNSFEQAGVSAIQLEDQVVPKRLHYHKGVHEIIEVDEMIGKLKRGIETRQHNDFLIIARTDAGRNKEEPFENAIRRANIYGSIGSDLVMVFPRNEEEMGYKMIVYPITPIITVYKHLNQIYTSLYQTGKTGYSQKETSQISKSVQNLISLEELLLLEKK